MSELIKTLVIGASENPERYSNKAVRRLIEKGYPVVAIGKKKGVIGPVTIETGFPDIKNIDTISLYLNPSNQKIFYNYLINLKPRRIIFNPGAENLEFEKICISYNIEPIEACTLVLLSIGSY